MRKLFIALLIPTALFLMSGPINSLDMASTDHDQVAANVDQNNNINLDEQSSDSFFGFYPYYYGGFYPYSYSYPYFYNGFYPFSSYPYYGYGYGAAGYGLGAVGYGLGAAGCPNCGGMQAVETTDGAATVMPERMDGDRGTGMHRGMRDRDGDRRGMRHNDHHKMKKDDHGMKHDHDSHMHSKMKSNER